jgi:hypothetical protein
MSESVRELPELPEPITKLFGFPLAVELMSTDRVWPNFRSKNLFLCLNHKIMIIVETIMNTIPQIIIPTDNKSGEKLAINKKLNVKINKISNEF